MIPYTITNNNITVVHKGKTHTFQRDTPQFVNLKKALLAEDWDDVPNHLTVAKSIESWAKGKFKYNGETFSYNGTDLERSFNQRIKDMASRGESPEPLFRFWERLQKNPSMRSVTQLWPFLAQKGIPLTKEGKFLAYKGVNNDYTDKYTGKISNKVGTVNEMPRNQISDDPNEACHEGLTH